MVLLTAARALRPLDVQLARDSLVEALAATLVSAQLTRSTSQLEIAREALAAPPATGPEQSISDLMLEGFGTRIATGFAESVPILRHAIEMLGAEDVESAGFQRWVVLGSNAAADMWDCEGYRDIADRLERIERDRGNLEALRITLGSRAHCEMWAGRFSLAEAIHTEASSIAVALGADGGIWELLKTELYAWQGKERETREAVTLMTGPLAEEVGAGVVVNLARIASVIIDLSHGRYDRALVVACDLYDDDSLPQGNQVLPEMVEAGVRSGDRAAAETALARLEERATASGTPWALGLLARSKALLASDSESEDLYLRAIAHLETTYVARTSPVHIYSTANGFAGRIGGSTPVERSERLTTCSRRWARKGLSSALASSSGPLVNGLESARLRQVNNSRPKRSRSPAWPLSMRPTSKSPLNCSSVAAPLITTCGRCFGSSA
jgi:hypothetical protein